jgi:hypothetical protein
MRRDVATGGALTDGLSTAVAVNCLMTTPQQCQSWLDNLVAGTETNYHGMPDIEGVRTWASYIVTQCVARLKDSVEWTCAEDDLPNPERPKLRRVFAEVVADANAATVDCLRVLSQFWRLRNSSPFFSGRHFFGPNREFPSRQVALLLAQMHQGTPPWLIFRCFAIGASNAGAYLNTNALMNGPRKQAVVLFEETVGFRETDPYDDFTYFCFGRGHAFEDLAIELGKAVIPGLGKVKHVGTKVSEDDPNFMMSPDGLVYDDDDGKQPHQNETVRDEGAIRKRKRTQEETDADQESASKRTKTESDLLSKPGSPVESSTDREIPRQSRKRKREELESCDHADSDATDPKRIKTVDGPRHVPPGGLRALIEVKSPAMKVHEHCPDEYWPQIAQGMTIFNVDEAYFFAVHYDMHETDYDPDKVLFTAEKLTTKTADRSDTSWHPAVWMRTYMRCLSRELLTAPSCVTGQLSDRYFNEAVYPFFFGRPTDATNTMLHREQVVGQLPTKIPGCYNSVALCRMQLSLQDVLGPDRARFWARTADDLRAKHKQPRPPRPPPAPAKRPRQTFQRKLAVLRRKA